MHSDKNDTITLHDFHQIAEGNEEIFRKVFEQYSHKLFPTIFQIVKDKNLADDIIQEAFLKLWIYRDKLTEIKSPIGWLYKIAIHQALTQLRKLVVKRNAESNLEKKVANNYSDDPEKALLFKSLTEKLAITIKMLPKQQQRVYKLSREYGYKTEEISKIMGISVQSVKNTMVRSLKFIRENLMGIESFIFAIIGMY